jgi:hypothetical protein
VVDVGGAKKRNGLLETYKIEYSRNALSIWNSLKTLSPVPRDGYNSLYDYCRATSRYHFDENRNDLISLDTDCPVVIPVKRFSGDWDNAVNELIKESNPASFKFRTTTRKSITNEWEENDFRRWGYDIDGGYTIANRILNPKLKDALHYVVESFGFVEPGIIKFDVQMPGQCFYWHIDNFGGVLKEHRGDYDSAAMGDLDQRNVMRTVIFLDDQRLGQVWQQGNLLLNWERGDAITWPWRDIPHGTCNYGHTPRPVLNITGVVTDRTRELLGGF